jgi:hypothetical protein
VLVPARGGDVSAEPTSEGVPLTIRVPVAKLWCAVLACGLAGTLTVGSR